MKWSTNLVCHHVYEFLLHALQFWLVSQSQYVWKWPMPKTTLYNVALIQEKLNISVHLINCLVDGCVISRLMIIFTLSGLFWPAVDHTLFFTKLSWSYFIAVQVSTIIAKEKVNNVYNFLCKINLLLNEKSLKSVKKKSHAQKYCNILRNIITI